MSRVLLSLFIIYFFKYQTATCQDSNTVKKVKILPVPAFGYSPETKTYIGAVSLFSFNFYNDTITRLSNAKIEFNYTWNKQIIADLGWNLFTRNEKWFTKGQIQYAQYPEFYYGIGSSTSDDNKVTYSSNRVVFEVYALRKIHSNLFTGLNVKHIHYWNVNQTVVGDINYPELSDASTNGIGYTILKDSRNNLLTPVSGIYAYANTTANFARSNYLELLLDLRYFKTWRSKYTAAVRLVNEFIIGTPPFYDYAIMGGDKMVRGFYYGRYRDSNLSTLQVEFRLPIVWRFGLASFGGISGIYPHGEGLSLKTIKYNGGIGLRFLVDKKDKTNLRLDYAVGSNDNSGFYIAFGESF
jgi:outer membrane protein assembly factor BamA